MIQFTLIALSVFLTHPALGFNWTPDSCNDPNGFQPQSGEQVYGHTSLSQSRQLYQGQTGTCYLHTVKQLLEHYHDPKFDFSFKSLINACPNSPNEGGHPHSVLHNLRRLKKTISLYDGGNSEFQVLECDIENRQGNPLLASLGHPIKNLHLEIDSIHKAYVDLDYNYNIHVREPHSVSPKDLQNEVDEILKSTNMPIAMTTNQHAVTLVGSGLLCCRNRRCKRRWLIRNSWGEQGSGWFDADYLSRQMVSDPNSNLTFLKKCNPSNIKVDNETKCEPSEIIGNYPLHYYATANDRSAILNSIAKGEDVNKPNADGRTPILEAAIMGNVESFETLAQNGANLNQASHAGYTPAMVASALGNLKMLKILARHGAEMNLASSDGYTAAYSAAESGQLGALKFLAKQGADLDQATVHGLTPETIAQNKGHDQIVHFIRQWKLGKFRKRKPSKQSKTQSIQADESGKSP